MILEYNGCGQNMKILIIRQTKRKDELKLYGICVEYVPENNEYAWNMFQKTMLKEN